MASVKIKMLSEEEFQKVIAQDSVTLVDFYADWCGPCRMLAPVLETVATEIGESATIAKLDIDKAQNTASQFQVTSIPTMILFKKGKEVGRLVGLRDATAIRQFITSA